MRGPRTDDGTRLPFWVQLGNPHSIMQAMRRRHYRRINPMGGRSKLIGSLARRGAPHFLATAATAAKSDFIRRDLRRRQLGQLNCGRLLHADSLEGTSTVGPTRWCLRFHGHIGSTGRGLRRLKLPSPFLRPLRRGFGTGFSFENVEPWRLFLPRNGSISLPRAAIRSCSSRTITIKSSLLNSSIGGLFAMKRPQLLSADYPSS